MEAKTGQSKLRVASSPTPLPMAFVLKPQTGQMLRAEHSSEALLILLTQSLSISFSLAASAFSIKWT